MQVQLQQALRELAAGEAGHKPAAAARTGWEYKVLDLRVHDEGWETEMNKLGADGWELAEIAVRTRAGNSESARILFKRAK